MGNHATLESEPLEVKLTKASFWGPPCDSRWYWAVRASSWLGDDAQDPEFQFWLKLLPPLESERVLKLRIFREMKKSLLGKLLALRACARASGLDEYPGLELRRTTNDKPFLFRPRPEGLPNFNFNVSHDGDWVVLASDPFNVVGVDVSATQRARGDPVDDQWMEDLSCVLTGDEMLSCRSRCAVEDRYDVFQRIWSVKEAYVKALGQGMDFGLGRIEVDVDRRRSWRVPEEQVSVFVDGCRSRWSFRQCKLPGAHWVSVALGPTADVMMDGCELSSTLWRCSSVECVDGPLAFEVLSLTALLPQSWLADYDALRH